MIISARTKYPWPVNLRCFNFGHFTLLFELRLPERWGTLQNMCCFPRWMLSLLWWQQGTRQCTCLLLYSVYGLNPGLTFNWVVWFSGLGFIWKGLLLVEGKDVWKTSVEVMIRVHLGIFCQSSVVSLVPENWLSVFALMLPVTCIRLGWSLPS